MNGHISRRQVMLGGAIAAVSGKAGDVWSEIVTDSSNMTGFEGAYQDGKYTLPALPYEYDALEPLYDKRILTIHHDKHHRGYVNGLNRTLDELASARAADDYGQIKALSRNLAFNGSGHVLHCLFWHSMTHGGSQIAKNSRLARVMEDSFGSQSKAMAQFAAATKAVEGSGWGILAYEPISGRLVILQSEKHQNLTIWAVAPLLVCDVWEHAYYLKYANDRGQWVDNFMKLANWEFASRRFEQVSNQRLI